MKPAETLITKLVLAAVETMPASERAKHYRAMASLSSDDTMVAEFAELAAECEQIERHHRQLVLDFKRRAEGGHAAGHDGNGRGEG